MEICDLKVLVSDDSMLVRKKTIDCLKELGCTAIFEASNGQEAVDIYKDLQPNIVFMDIVMPVKTGLEALIEILEFDSSAYVVIASSTGTQSNLKAALEAGARDFLQKPIEAHQISKILTNLCKGVE